MVPHEVPAYPESGRSAEAGVLSVQPAEVFIQEELRLFGGVTSLAWLLLAGLAPGSCGFQY